MLTTPLNPYICPMSHLVAPSILSADFAHLGDDIEMLNKSQADWIHVDVMDGHFVPNISFGFPIMEAIKPLAKKPLDVHIMVVEPERYVERFVEAGADILTIHLEATPNIYRTVTLIKDLGAKAGVVINPQTTIDALEAIIYEVDLVLVMSVNPGYGGQKFIPYTFEKVEHLKELIRESKTDVLIEVDGGVTEANAKQLLEAGADVLVAGSAIFNSSNPTETISRLKNISPDNNPE